VGEDKKAAVVGIQDVFRLIAMDNNADIVEEESASCSG
jgi:hypothetical protein